MTSDAPSFLDPRKIRSLLDLIARAFHSDSPNRQAEAVNEALKHAFQKIEALEIRVTELEDKLKNREP